MSVTIIMWISFITNLFLSIIKIVIGYIFNSGALIADGVHSCSDLTTDVIAVVGATLSKKPADTKHPYGHGKIEYLTSLIIGIVILFLGLSIIGSSFNRQIVVPSIVVAIVTVFTIVAKYILSSFLIKEGKMQKNNILISSGKESRTDVVSSIVVLISSVAMRFSNQINFLKYADIVAMIIVGIFIVRVGFLILKENISILIGECETDEEIINNLKTIILDFKNIKKIDKINLLKYGSYYELTCEISIDSNLSFIDAHSTVHGVEDIIRKDNDKIKYITIHANPNDSI